MNGLLDAMDVLTRLWVWTYTLGLDGDSKQERREEITSDLWEQQAVALRSGESPTATASAIAFRVLLGIPADLVWRLEMGLASRQRGRNPMNETLPSRLGLLVGLALAAFPVIFGINVISGSGDWDSAIQRILWGGVWIVTGIAIITGLLITPRHYGAGMALIIVGVIGFGISTFWMAFVTVPVGLGILALAHWRGRHASPPPTVAVS